MARGLNGGGDIRTGGHRQVDIAGDAGLLTDFVEQNISAVGSSRKAASRPVQGAEDSRHCFGDRNPRHTLHCSRETGRRTSRSIDQMTDEKENVLWALKPFGRRRKRSQHFLRSIRNYTERDVRLEVFLN